MWNNSSLGEGIKHAEKRITMLLFPALILGQEIHLDIKKILRYYSIITTTIMLIVFIRFVLFFPELFYKYLEGRDLWEMGYRFGDSMGMHAPALNMHVAFVAVINFYFFIKSFETRGRYLKMTLNLFLMVASIFILLYINTRLAIVNAFIGFLIVILYQSKRRFSA
ncbi:MAG: O-antigen ligase domain-containing protein, partial [Leeuwenhoekiella sp.]